MPNNDEPVKQAVKQHKPWSVMMNQWWKCNKTYHTQLWWTSEGSATKRTIPSNDEPAREVQQNVPYPVMMNQWGKWNKTYHTQLWWTSEGSETKQTIHGKDEPAREGVWYVLFHFPHWFIIAGYGTFCFTSVTGSSLLGMVRFVALPSLVHLFNKT
jgi:hypothetical protein